jgi:hypothetical protein
MPGTPYAAHLDGRDPVEVLRLSLADYESLIATFTPALWATSYAPGKWTAQQLMVHVAQWELIFGVRVRCAAAMPNFVVQPLDQDPFMETEGAAVDGPTAWAAFRELRRMNIAFMSRLSSAQRKAKVRHPERGDIDVEDLMTTLAGHPVHHYKQLVTVK